MYNNTPLFSIVIPTYNNAHLIGRCLESILAQSFNNWEAIVINNFSEDNTIDIVENYKDPRIRLINNANEGVIAISRNKGIIEAHGEWICFLDSDDWWAPTKLEQTQKYINDYDFIYHGLQIVSKRSSPFIKKNLKTRQVKKDVACDLLVNTNIIANSSVAIRKSIINRVGLLSEERELIGVEDFDYWIRVSRVSTRFKFIPKQLGYYWVGENVSASLKQIGKETFLYNKYKYLLTTNQWIQASAMFSCNHAYLYQHEGNFRKASQIYINILHSNTNFKIKIKTFFALIISLMRYKR
jgi:glycosyltransferase involved in cell wall biosynthesis